MTPEQRALVDGARERAELRRDPIAAALCDLADEQASRIASLEASVALLDGEGRKMKFERDDMTALWEATLAAGQALKAERDTLQAERAADRAAFEHALAEREGDVAHLKAELDALKADVAARDAVGEQVARHFAEERGERVLFIPSIQAALDVGLNGFGFKLVGETFVAALPRNPERRAIVVRFRAKGTLVDVEVRLAPVVEEGGAT